MSSQSLQGNIVRGLSPTGDFTYGTGLSGYLQGNAAIGQQIGCRLKQFLGECFWDLGAGIDWFGWLGGKNSIGLNLAINTVILNTPGVLMLNGSGFDADPVTREFSVKWNVTTIYSRFFPGNSTLNVGG